MKLKKNKNIIISNGNIITPFYSFKGSIIVKEGKIIALDKKNNVPNGFEVIDAENKFVVPGFIDIHVHGGGGADIMDGTKTAIKKVAETHCRCGTTSFLPTTMTMNNDKITSSLKNINKVYLEGTGSAEILGIHLEGPYINPEKKGAQKEIDISKPSISEFQKFNEASGNLIKMITIAPETTGAIGFIDQLSGYKIIVSIGHSDATYEQVMKSINAGLSHVTHIFNAMRGLHHREPGVVGAALSSSELSIELIADGIHVHPKVMEILIKLKGAEKIILITDAMRAAGKPDGKYDLGGQEVIVKNGQAKLKNGTIAGSVLTMDKAIRNLVETVGISLIEAIQMATISPAECLGIEGKKGSLKPGKDADIVILNRELEVELTMVKGKVIYMGV